MGEEIERKFLVKSNSWRKNIEKSAKIRQGFFLSIKDRAVRIRVKGKQGFITMKSESHGFTRKEFEYEIPVVDAEEILETLCTKPIVEKTRNWVTYADKVWVIDDFHGANNGLIMAEIELDSEMEDVARPDWAGNEVSDNPRYYNVYLARHPFTTWDLNPKTELGRVHLEHSGGISDDDAS
ncbi:MAG: CYTH domain-containing protein [Magnetococcales bacterium]|nr:CYTH domain-containing protein [Magnetococcales bacterium]